MWQAIRRWWWTKKRRSRIKSTYYVAGDGDDTLPGTHPLHAWQTIQRLNQAQREIQPGDQVLFKRGFSYPGIPFYLDLPAVIIIGAYGSGAYPEFPDVPKK